MARFFNNKKIELLAPSGHYGHLQKHGKGKLRCNLSWRQIFKYENDEKRL